MSKEDKVLIQIPFMGFYESIHDMRIDQAIEDGFNYNYETGEDQEIPEKIWEAPVDYKAIFKEYAKEYTELFGEQLGLDLEFEEMTSPREYNFSTDRLFALAPREQIDKIRKEVEKDKEWPEYIKERFTDRSGFWSFYSNDSNHEEWTREELDCNQYEPILMHFLYMNHRDDPNNFYDYVDFETYLTEDLEMSNWDSVIKAHEVIEEYLKEE